MRRWLRRDGKNRAWRTILQGIVAVMLGAAGDAAIQVVQRALIGAMAGQPMDWQQVATTAGYAGGTAALMALLAYLHRTKVDPSPLPSAQPPAPPELRPEAATRGAMQPTAPS